MYVRASIWDSNGTLLCSECRVPLDHEQNLIGLTRSEVHDIYRCLQWSLNIGRPVLRKQKDSVMSKQMMSVQDAAETLVKWAQETSLDEFPRIAEEMLEDNSPGEIAAIGAYLPDVLRELLPKRTLH